MLRGRRRARQPRNVIAKGRSIHDRPEAVQERKDAGHWEGDLLICRRTRPVLVLKEREGTVELMLARIEKHRSPALRPYAAATAPVISAQIAKACARAVRYSAAGR